jgi:hypothetical protein
MTWSADPRQVARRFGGAVADAAEHTVAVSALCALKPQSS